MIIKSIELKNYRNYKNLNIELSKGTNIFYGDNAQGKTNILESIYVGSTTKSHRGSRDKEIINFESDDSHIKIIIERDGISRRIDMHLKKNKPKGIAIDGIPIKKSTELLGVANVVLFSPEDLGMIKNGPSERRKFIDMELCQLDKIYLYNLSNYNKLIMQRNKLLKDAKFLKDIENLLDVWDEKLVCYGKEIIKKRLEFIKQLNYIIYDIHKKLSSDKEILVIKYEPSVDIDNYSNKIFENRNRDIRMRTTMVGIHRDDISFYIDNIDIRKFGSQGQQRTAALSLKLAEIELVKNIIKDNPILLLDDVLSELDNNRQNQLLNNIKNIQTFVTCTGLEDFISKMKSNKDYSEIEFNINKIFKVKEGKVSAVEFPKTLPVEKHLC
jgi:recF protein